MAHAANSVVMARSENMTCIPFLIYLQKLHKAGVSCDGYIGILLWTSYVKTAAARTVYAYAATVGLGQGQASRPLPCLQRTNY